MIRDKSHRGRDVVIANMADLAPAGCARLPRWTHVMLRELTAELITASPGAAAEYRRFQEIGQRELPVASPDLAGTCALVTGGTGCIGSALLAQLQSAGAARLVSVSRGLAATWPRWAGVRYETADIRDSAGISRLMRAYHPDLVFHLAAQRDPGQGAQQVHRTVTTNVTGTANTLKAAAEAGVPRFVYASTGKAVRPYSPEVYTATKKAAEWLCAQAAEDTSMLVSAGRFTHVLDNSIIHDRLRAWALDEDMLIRLHHPEIVFYVQSARESAQLLISAGGAPGQLRIHAITDLGWPVGLLDVALGVLDREGSKTPVYFAGYDEGYEQPVPDGLYDPAVSWDVSPLINGAEAAHLAERRCPGIDAFDYQIPASMAAWKKLADLTAVCDLSQDSGKILPALDAVSRELSPPT